MSDKESKIVWDEVDFGRIIQHWINEYDQSKKRLIHHDYLFDPVKNKVLIKLYVEDQADE